MEDERKLNSTWNYNCFIYTYGERALERDSFVKSIAGRLGAAPLDALLDHADGLLGNVVEGGDCLGAGLEGSLGNDQGCELRRDIDV